jgi:hypothetical protein
MQAARITRTRVAAQLPAVFSVIASPVLLFCHWFCSSMFS